ncbi:hypothetical protein [Vibrio anguillarum]|uniref:hypothetical protein n=1 Tax=Vibrio anguillarum TaxID=55601 RepID=UPI0018DFBAE0|nr:hypothetical protein [Vibrio anguillarum]
MLALYGDAQGNRAQRWVPDSLNTRNIKSLSRRLSALEKDRLRESNRLEASEISDANDRVKSSIVWVIEVINEEISSIEQEIELIISADSDMNKNHKLLQSIVGIGKVMSRELVYLFTCLPV